jgi:hypothetical protein
VKLTAADRRRLVLASVLTAVAFPAVWWENEQGSSANRSNIAAVGLPAEGGGAAPAGSSPMAIESPAYLTPASAAGVTAPGATALIGRPDDQLVARTLATFRRRVGRADACWYGGVAEGTVLTVVNPANGQSIQCRVVGRDDGEPGVVVLAPAAFVELADFTDAPIHVELRR